jgi:hypothetical protein
MRPRQVQDFIPTPMSMAACMYYTGIDPLTREPVYTAKEMKDKRLQKALLLYWDPQHHDEAREALLMAKRGDLIGSGPKALVPPATGKGALPIRQRERGSHVRRPNKPGRTFRR